VSKFLKCWEKLSGIETDFKPYGAQDVTGKFVIYAVNPGKEYMKGGKKSDKPGQPEGFQKTLNGFNTRADRTAFSGTVMIMVAGDQGFGGKNRKGNAGSQKEKKNFIFEAWFHWL
jgi:hypothetical protein